MQESKLFLQERNQRKDSSALRSSDVRYKRKEGNLFFRRTGCNGKELNATGSTQGSRYMGPFNDRPRGRELEVLLEAFGK
jgi:hypothetical protein